ncbi:type II toxin-antitoxin system RelE/ParE family toxin [Neisseriaceae bacterium B1]
MIEEYAGQASSERYYQEFNRVIELAAANPYMGRAGIVANTRELHPIQGKYRIVYQLDDKYLYILMIKSTKQLHNPETFERDWRAISS